MPPALIETKTRIDALHVIAVQVVAQFATLTTDVEKQLLVLHALTRAHLDGMDASMEIMTKAIDQLGAKRS